MTISKEEGILEEYRSLRSEIMKRIEARLFILSFTMATVGAVLGFALKDGVSILQKEFYLVIALTSFALIVIIAALVATIQYTQQNMIIASYIIKYIEKPDRGLQYETRLEALREVKRGENTKAVNSENNQQIKTESDYERSIKQRTPITSSDSLALFYALLTISVCALAIYSAGFVVNPGQLIALSIVLTLAASSFFCSYDLIVRKAKHTGGWQIAGYWDLVDKRLEKEVKICS